MHKAFANFVLHQPPTTQSTLLSERQGAQVPEVVYRNSNGIY